MGVALRKTNKSNSPVLNVFSYYPFRMKQNCRKIWHRLSSNDYLWSQSRKDEKLVFCTKNNFAQKILQILRCRFAQWDQCSSDLILDTASYIAFGPNQWKIISSLAPQSGALRRPANGIIFSYGSKWTKLLDQKIKWPEKEAHLKIIWYQLMVPKKKKKKCFWSASNDVGNF